MPFSRLAMGWPLFESINHGPGGALPWGTRDFHDNVIGTCRRRSNVSRRKSSFLPRVIFDQLPFPVINMNRNPGIVHVCPHPKPVIVPLEKCVRNCFFLFQPEVAAPLIVSDCIA